MILYAPLYLQVICDDKCLGYSNSWTIKRGFNSPYSYHEGPRSALTLAYTRETDGVVRGIGQGFDSDWRCDNEQALTHTPTETHDDHTPTGIFNLRAKMTHIIEQPFCRSTTETQADGVHPPAAARPLPSALFDLLSRLLRGLLLTTV